MYGNCSSLLGSGGLALTGKAADLKSAAPQGAWGFESLALRHTLKHLRHAFRLSNALTDR